MSLARDLLDRIRYRLKMNIPLGFMSKPGWTGQIPFYKAYCNTHKAWFIAYPEGHAENLVCPICRKEAYENRNRARAVNHA